MTLEILKNVDISPLCSFKLTGYLPQLIQANTIEELQSIKQKYSNVFILGKGSNTLINPNHTYDAVVKLSPTISPIECHHHHLKVPASTSVNKLMNLSKIHGLSGLEFAAGVPASIGGMVTMNFGCWGQEISELIAEITIIDTNGQLKTIQKIDCEFAYRNSCILTKKWAILDVTLTLKPETNTIIQKNIQESIQKRLDKQPLRKATFGSVFKNPSSHFAAALIEKTGLKGKKFDTIQVSEKHANFLENFDQATYKDAIHAIQYIQKAVMKTHHINLETEVQLMSSYATN